MTRRVLLSLLPLAFWKPPKVRALPNPVKPEYERWKAARIHWLLNTDAGRARLAFCVEKFDKACDELNKGTGRIKAVESGGMISDTTA